MIFMSRLAIIRDIGHYIHNPTPYMDFILDNYIGLFQLYKYTYILDTQGHLFGYLGYTGYIGYFTTILFNISN